MIILHDLHNFTLLFYMIYIILHDLHNITRLVYMIYIILHDLHNFTWLSSLHDYQFFYACYD
jgi:hypothetical protein